MEERGGFAEFLKRPDIAGAGISGSSRRSWLDGFWRQDEPEPAL